MMKMTVGIEAISVAVPRRYLELEDLALARGVEPSKYTQGLGGRRMAVADPGEDAVALAATAARRLITRFNVDTSKLGLLVVGTESGVDLAKPVASHVQGLLELPKAMRVFDIQHACYAGTAGLMAACEWIASGVGEGRSALVICSDIARYGVKTAGEPTQGGAAVAMLVSQNPRLLALDLGLSGSYSADVYDFWRPVGRREPLVDGHYSIACYLEAVAGAFAGWRTRALAHEVVRTVEADCITEQLARIAYHAPFCKMAKKAHSHLRTAELTAQGPLSAAQEAQEKLDAASSFERQVASSLGFCADIGNAYTASLYLGLASMLNQDAGVLGGKRVGLFSYGSGCASEFFSGVVGMHAAEVMATADVAALLELRKRTDIAEYEAMMALAPDAPLAESPAPGTFRLVSVKDGKRQYAAG